MLHLWPLGIIHKTHFTMGSCNPPASQELNILLVGPRRTGKSCTGNTLLGRGQLFDIRGGGASTAASTITAGRHMNVVDAQGWSSFEEFVPEEEKTELLRAVSLCGLNGPHVVLLVIPLLDFTESERRAVERRMEILTSTVWRHTMVLFTCGDWLRRRGRSVEEHIQSGGPALRWLMEKCCYRYHVFNNKAATIGKQEKRKQEMTRGVKKWERIWQRKIEKDARRSNTGGEADGRKEEEQEQVRELLSKLERMLQENGGWHFSLHMYQKLEEERSRKEQELRARLEAETGVGSVRRNQKTAETKIHMEPEQEQKLETEKEERQEDSQRKKHKNKEEGDERKMNRGVDTDTMMAELKRPEMDWLDTSYDRRGEQEEGTEVKFGIMAACRPYGVIA